MDSQQLPVTSKESSLPSDVGSQEEKTDQQKDSGTLKTPSSLRDTPPSQGESLNEPHASSPMPHASEKTQGVRPPRGTQAQALEGAAGRAARSGRRNDVHEYMRIRRSFV